MIIAQEIDDAPSSRQGRARFGEEGAGLMTLALLGAVMPFVPLALTEERQLSAAGCAPLFGKQGAPPLSRHGWPQALALGAHAAALKKASCRPKASTLSCSTSVAAGPGPAPPARAQKLPLEGKAP